MDATVVIPVRVRLNGVQDLDQAQSYARHIIEKGTLSEGEVSLPTGVKLLDVECGTTTSVQERNRVA